MWYNRGMRNDIVLSWDDGGVVQSGHFKLSEFASKNGLVVVDSGLVVSLELVRRDLCHLFGCDVQIIITSGTRLESENVALAERLGWTDAGGAVARDSRHLPKYGGIAVDLFARRQFGQGYEIVSPDIVAETCRQHFRYVKGDYADGHVHADNRKA